MGLSSLGGGIGSPPVTVSFMSMPGSSGGMAGMVPVTADMLQQAAPPQQLQHSNQAAKAVNTIVTDWDSEEETK